MIRHLFKAATIKLRPYQLQGWADMIVTDERLDKIYRGCGRVTEILAVIAVAGLITFVIGPAIVVLVMR
jgi:hypothetical protein